MRGKKGVKSLLRRGDNEKKEVRNTDIQQMD